MLPVQDVAQALEFYTGPLGFTLLFADTPVAPTYAGVKRDGVEIHLQWHDPAEWIKGLDRPMIRILCEDPDRLFEEFGNFSCQESSGLKNTPWGTREFGLYDPCQNALIFYKNL